MASIAGKVTYRERIMLPTGATLEVTMCDVARADAPAELIATARFPASAGPPFAFTLTFDPAALTPQGRYTVRAVLRAGGRLLFTTTEHIPALGLDPDQPIVLARVGGAPRPPDSQARPAQ